MAGIPPVLPTDAEDVAWALQTADALWKRGERADAIVWLRRAAQSAGDAMDDDRALALARMAADLAELMAAAIVHVEPDPVPVTGGGVDELLRVSSPDIPISISEPDLGSEDEPTTMEVDTRAYASTVSSLTEDSRAPSAPSAAEAHAGMLDPWALPPPLPPIARAKSQVFEEDEVVTSARKIPAAVAQAIDEIEVPAVAVPLPKEAKKTPSEPPVAEAKRPAPPPPPKKPPPLPPKPPKKLAARRPRSRDSFSPEGSSDAPPSPVLEEEGKVYTTAPLSMLAAARSKPPSSPPPPLEDELPPPEETLVSPQPAAAPKIVAPVADKVTVVDEAEEARKRAEEVRRKEEEARAEEAARQAEEEARRKEEEARRAEEEKRRQEEEARRAEEEQRRQEEEKRRAEEEEARRAEEEARRAEEEARAKQAAETPVSATATTEVAPNAISLEEVAGLQDLPDDERAKLAGAAKVHRLARDEEVGGFALAMVVKGEVDVSAQISDTAAERLSAGTVLASRGTLPEGVPLRLVCASSEAVIATWTADLIDPAFEACPWVLDELRAQADRVQALVGVTLGPLADRLDAALRRHVTSRMQLRELAPGELVVEQGAQVRQMLIVGQGHLELANGEEISELGAGDLLFPQEILGAGAAPATVRAGKGGALVFATDRAVAQELMVTCPPLLEILGGM